MELFFLNTKNRVLKYLYYTINDCWLINEPQMLKFKE